MLHFKLRQRNFFYLKANPMVVQYTVAIPMVDSYSYGGSWKSFSLVTLWHFPSHWIVLKAIISLQITRRFVSIALYITYRGVLLWLFVVYKWVLFNGDLQMPDMTDMASCQTMFTWKFLLEKYSLSWQSFSSPEIA